MIIYRCARGLYTVSTVRFARSVTFLLHQSLHRKRSPSLYTRETFVSRARSAHITFAIANISRLCRDAMLACFEISYRPRSFAAPPPIVILERSEESRRVACSRMTRADLRFAPCGPSGRPVPTVSLRTLQRMKICFVGVDVLDDPNKATDISL